MEPRPTIRAVIGRRQQRMNGNLMLSRGSRLPVSIFALALGLAACGGGNGDPAASPSAPTSSSPPAASAPATTTTPPPSPEPCEAGGEEFTLVAVEFEFDARCLTVPADTPIVIQFDNQDEGISHNVVITPTDTTMPAFQGELIQGPAEITYTIDGLPVDDYRFFCERHPVDMVVDFTVE